MLENQNQNSEVAKSDTAKSKARFENRRRLLKALAVAAPLIITLRGKPAHAQLSSLGSAGITYGPGAYVTQNDIDANGSILESGDLGKAVKIDKDTGKKTVLTPDGQDRRDPSKVETKTGGGTKTFP